MPYARLAFFLSLSSAAAALACGACSEPKNEAAPPHGNDAPPPPPPTAPRQPQAARDAGAKVALEDGGAAPYDGPLIGALFMQTPIMSEMAWPSDSEDRSTHSVRIGYIRQGAKVPVIPEAHVKPNCKEGWYELVQGGFVCGRYATLDLQHPKIRTGPHPPFTEGSLPYQYAYNVANGTPLYKTIPSREERLRLEPWLAPKKKPKPKPVEEEESDPAPAAYGDDVDAGIAIQLTRTIAATTTDPFGLSAEEEADAGTPWYLRDYDGGKPQVTLDDLKGEGPMSRRMVKGFFLALDKEVTQHGVKWWKTTGGLLAPHNRVFVYTHASEFHGVWLDGRAPEAEATDGGAPAAPHAPIENLCKPGSKAQVAVILYYKAHKYELSESKKAAIAGEPLPRHTVVRLTGERVVINGARYEETDEGFWIRAAEATHTRPGDPPRDLAPGEKWIDVDLKSQTLVAYEGDRAVYATAVSTGKEDKEDPEKDHKTPTGTWRIREKHIAATMDGDVASDGPYSIEDVPWIMYFNGSYALHGAFWHNQFGHTKSHGCVNLAPRDAKALFGWTEPHLPQGWHGVWSTPENQGTRIVVHE